MKKAEQCGHLGTGLGEAEDVVDEQQHVLALVTEVLGFGQTREAHAQTGSRRLVHLTVDQAGLLDNAGVGHLEVEVGTLAGTLAHAGEHGGAAMLLSQVVDELLDADGLAHASAAEQTGLTALDVGLDEVDDLDAGLEGPPSTFQIRPRVALPTGIMMGTGVGCLKPRTMPSVDVIATVRTMSPGRCVCTSSTVDTSPVGVCAFTVRAL